MGPSILSRGTGNSGDRVGEVNAFKFFAGASGVYDNGLTPLSVDPSGNLISVNHLWGLEANAGAYGRHRWSHGSIGMDYTGDYRNYTAKSFYNGSDNVVGLDTAVDLTKRLSLVARVKAGSVSRALSTANGFVTTPDELLGVPTSEVFDNRSYYLQTSEQVVYQKTARLSFSAAGNGFFVRRHSKALVGVDGYGASGTIAYRLNRRSTVDLGYTFLHFDYPRAFGEANIHQLTVGYSRLLSQRWQAGIMAGTMSMNTIGITDIKLDPAVAALFGGQTNSFAAFDKTKYLPVGTATVVGHYKRNDVNFSFSQAPNPGNGVYLASSNRSANATYTYTGISHWLFTGIYTFSSLDSVGQAGLGTYSYSSVGAGVSYRLGRNVYANLRADGRSVQIDRQSGLSRLGSRIVLGITYSPGERPLNIWR